jgi:hypothetical protein
MEGFPPPIPPAPTARFRPCSAIEQVTCLLGVEGLAEGLAEGSAGGLAEDLAEDLVAGEEEVRGGKACFWHRVTPLQTSRSTNEYA